MLVDREPTQTIDRQGFGDVLRQARESRGMSLRDVASATKISLSQLQAMECNNFEALPGGAFTRGFVRAYATHVGLDAEEMVNRYLFALSGSGEAGAMPPEASLEEGRRRRQRHLVLTLAAVLVLTLTAVAVWLLLG